MAMQIRDLGIEAQQITVLLSLLVLLSGVPAANADASPNNARYRTTFSEPDTFAYNWEPYVETVEKQLQQVWNPQTGGETTVCMLHLRLNQDGSIGRTGIQNTSNNPEFDQAALEAMKAAAPFPPFFDKSLDRLHLHVSFRRTSIGNFCKAFIFLPGGYKETQETLARRNLLETKITELKRHGKNVNSQIKDLALIDNLIESNGKRHDCKLHRSIDKLNSSLTAKLNILNSELE